MNTLKNLFLLPFHDVINPDSTLVVYEGGKTVPFYINRVFTIHAAEVCTRGFHAHKECSQILVVLKGACVVTCDDGMNRREILLDKANEGLLIPPTIWAEQKYETGTILMVLTDKPYDENDYLRNYEEFLNYRNIK